MARNPNLYEQLIARIFAQYYQPGVTEFAFTRAEIIATAEEPGLKLPKNVRDVLYTFHYHKPLPEAIRQTAPAGYEWTIAPAGIANYKFVLLPEFSITPSPLLAETKIPDATPNVINRYAHYVIPVQAKGGRDRIGRVQIEQDIAMCTAKFPDLICIPIAAQFMPNDVIALFAFENTDDRLAISAERHYRLVRADELTTEELLAYRTRTA